MNFLKKHGGKVIKTKRPSNKTSNTKQMQAILFKGKVVGVGESIGTVYALLGEGIIPSMQCVEIFLENMNDFKAYEKAVEEHYKVYAKVFNFVRAKIQKDFNFFKSLTRLFGNLDT